MLEELAKLRAPAGQAGEIVRREQNYFAGHAPRMNYLTGGSVNMRPEATRRPATVTNSEARADP